MARALICLMLVAPLVGACDGKIDWNQILNDVAEQLRPPDGSTVPGEPCILRFSNVSTQALVGTIELTYTLDDGSTSKETADINIPSDYAGEFDTGCPTSMRFNASLGTTPFQFSLTKGTDFECGELLEFAAGPGTYVRFVNTPL